MHFLFWETADWNLTLCQTGNKTKFPDSVSDQDQYFSVIAGKKRTLRTVTAVVGIKGIGIYLEADSEKTYLCTCTALHICR